MVHRARWQMRSRSERGRVRRPLRWMLDAVIREVEESELLREWVSSSLLGS